MERIIPLTGSTATGPLGLYHLPRLWVKAVLKAADRLEEGYNSGYRGFDKRLIDTIGLDAEATFAFLGTLPTYPQFERWVRTNAKDLNDASRERLNTGIAGHQRPAEIAAEVRAAIGLDDGETRGGVMLNNLDDWY